MSSPDRVAGDKVYQFITDPDHRENLSGRVRAACINCRRKKIKCSGEVNCRTCQERGLICEGLPERKKIGRSLDLTIGFEANKPRQDSSTSGRHPSSSGSSRQESFSTSTSDDRRRSSTRRPTNHLIAQNSADSSDSGYFSSGRQSESHLRLGSIPSFDEELGDYERPNALPANWSYFKGPTSGSFSSNAAVKAEQRPEDGEAAPMEWSSTENENLWWPKTDGGEQPCSQQSPEFSHLLSTAHMLEEQAHSLRRLAFHQASEDYKDHTRKPMAVSVPARSSSQPARPPELDADSALDDMTLIYGGKVSASSSAVPQLANSYNTWWDTDTSAMAGSIEFPAGNYASPLQHSPMQSSGIWQQQQSIPTPGHPSPTPQQSPRQPRAAGKVRHQSTPDPSSFAWPT